MHRTIVIRREYLHYVSKYNRYEKRHKNLAAHVSPAFRVEEGDWVTVGQCRPLSKTVRFQSRKISNSYAKKIHFNDGAGGYWLVILDFCLNLWLHSSPTSHRSIIHFPVIPD
jgi:ribosomal protein S17